VIVAKAVWKAVTTAYCAFAEGEGPGSAASIVHTGQTKQEHVLTDLLLHHAVDDTLSFFSLCSSPDAVQIISTL
jgi:hypothetical protein